MGKTILRAALGLLGLLGVLLPTAAQSQTSPNLIFGQVLTPGQWNALFAAKQDYLGAPVCLLTGCVFTGKVVTTASTVSGAGFNLPHGTTPTNPVNGDLWTTSLGLYARINGVTTGPFTAANTTATFTQAVTINLNGTALQSPQTGTALQVGQADGVATRIEADAYGAAPRFTCLRVDGTNAVPTPVQSGDELCSLNAFGQYNTTQGGTIGPQAAFRTYASQAWSIGAYGTYADLALTLVGSSNMVEVVKWQVLNLAGAGSETIFGNSIGVTSTDAEVLSNTIAATSVLQQWSPRLHLQGQGWKTASTAASETLDFIQELQTFSGTSAPTGALVWSAQVNGAGYSPLMSLYADGGLTLGSPTGGDEGAGTLNLGGPVYISGSAFAIGNLASIGANTVVGQTAAGVPIALPVNACTGALTYANGVGFGCNSGVGTGTVTSVATSYPLSGGPVTTTGTVTYTGPTNSGRLTVSSTTALKFSPYNGDTIKIAGVVYQIPAAGIAGCGNTSVYVGGSAGQNLAASTFYYVYAFINSGTVTCNFSTTGHSSDTTAGNIGTEILTGTSADSLVGMVFTDASSHFNDSVALRNTGSWFNRASKSLIGASTAAGTTVSSILTEINTAARVQMVSWSDETTIVGTSGVSKNSVTSNTETDIGVDGTAASCTAASNPFPPGAGDNMNAAVNCNVTPAEGHHYITITGAVGSGTGTYTEAISGSVMN